MCADNIFSFCHDSEEEKVRFEGVKRQSENHTFPGMPASQAAETLPMVVVQEQNWTAVLKILSSICQSQDEVANALNELPTSKQMMNYEQNQALLYSRFQTESEQREQTIRTMLNDMSKELTKQAGSLSVEYSSRLKEQESWRQKLSSNLFKILIASQLIQLILLTILLLWLR